LDINANDAVYINRKDKNWNEADEPSKESSRLVSATKN
jgi:hypothetical protein